MNLIERLAAFQNPEFYKRQSTRLPTTTTPRVIAYSEDLPKHVALARGCLVELEVLLRAHEFQAAPCGRLEIALNRSAASDPSPR